MIIKVILIIIMTTGQGSARPVAAINQEFGSNVDCGVALVSIVEQVEKKGMVVISKGCYEY
jgi:hypothetical protein